MVLWFFTSGSITPLSKSIIYIGENQVDQILKITGYQNHIYPKHISIIQASINDIASLSMSMWLRSRVWMAGVGSGVNVSDQVVRIFAWCVILWIISGWAGWWVGKNHILAGLLPALAVLTLSCEYTNSDLFPLWIMCTSITCLFSFNTFGVNLQRWIQFRVDYAELIISNTFIAASILIILLALFGWVLPYISFKDMVDQYRRRSSQENQAARSLGLEFARETARPLPAVLNPIRSPGLPNNHLLGSGPELSQQIIFTVHTGEKAAYIPSSPEEINIKINQEELHHYWSSYRFDIYTGTGWVSSPVVSRTESGREILFDIPPGYRMLTQDFVVENGNSGILYWSGMIFSSDFPFEAAWRIFPDPSISMIIDPFQGADIFGAVNNRQKYQVKSLISSISEDQLRKAGRVFPNNIQQNYTKLPASVPERVYSLARNLTSSRASPYDEAKALEKYLRDNYPYNLNVSLPPVGADVVDYFLFDLKEGYCDYYASAMVVMARSIGLPARLVSGFASGLFDDSEGTFTVRASDAHAWVEIYFSGIGWVEFEPTANQPEFIHNVNIPETVLSEKIPGSVWNNFFQSNNKLPDVARIFIFVLLGLICILFFVGLFESVFFAIANSNTVLIYIYKAIRKQAKKLSLNSTAGQTAMEFAEAIEADYPIISLPITRITTIYNRILFSPEDIQKHEIKQVISDFRKLRWKLLWIQIKKKQ